ncbi:MAG: MscL family protein, partial [Caldilineaceae bacterium]|nr:MscL family protein [Caldilineaceae bacterium]
QAARVNELTQLSYNGIKYGNFLAAILHFLVIAFVMFLIVRTMNHLIQQREEQAPPPPAPPAEVALLTEIRDLLKQSRPQG